MKRALACIAACAVALAVEAAAPVTRLCDRNFAFGELVVGFNTSDAASRFAARVNDPGADPALLQRLWQPKRATYTGFVIAVLVYESAQDTSEIASALMADPAVRDMGLMSAAPNTHAMDFAVLPPPLRITATEYYNRLLDHYFLSSSDAENAILDAGGAGPGWERTGEKIDTIGASLSHGAQRVFRFYAPGARSHFFTVDPAECGTLRNVDPGWLFEGDAFGAKLPVNGACPGGTTPVYRLYNNRWRENDSNHRFVTRLDLYDQTIARGWVGEGVAMCAIN